MVSLVDIIDVRKSVTIRGNAFEVEGINAEALGRLIVAYPELRMLFAGRAPDLSVQQVIALGPKIVASIIAAAIGKLGDEAEEAAAAKLTIGEQVTIFTAVAEVTFPDGFGPFVAKLRSLGLLDGAEPDASGWAPGTNSQKPPSPSQVTGATEGSAQSSN